MEDKNFNIAIVGRPNVGKSTLFNKLTHSTKALVAKIPGVTRDYQIETVYADHQFFNLIDTSGFEMHKHDVLRSLIDEKFKDIVKRSDAFLFLCDGQEPLTELDHALLKKIRCENKPIIKIVNKMDTTYFRTNESEFYEFFGGDFAPISSERGTGLNELLDKMSSSLPLPMGESPVPPYLTKVTIMGRPNVGKSTLMNGLLSEDRMIVSELPGTTRDAIDSLMEWNGKRYLFIDTAGLRKRARISEKIEAISVGKALSSLERSDLLLLVIDATQEPTDQDLKIAELAWDRGVGVIILINKWDLLDIEKRTNTYWQKILWTKFRMFHEVPFLFISALTKRNIHKVFDVVDESKRMHERVLPAQELSQFFLASVAENPPPRHPVPRGILRRGARSGRGAHRGAFGSNRMVYVPIKFFRCKQADHAPPVFEIKTNFPKNIPESYTQYLKKRFREKFGFWGIPIRIRYTRISVLIFALMTTFMLSGINFLQAESLQDLLFKGTLHTLYRHFSKAPQAFGPWEDEIGTAIREATCGMKVLINFETYTALYRMVRSPSEALRFIERRGRGVVEKDIFTFLQQNGGRAALGRLSPEISLPVTECVSSAYVRAYYIRRIKQQVESVGYIRKGAENTFKEINPVLENLKEYFLYVSQKIAKDVSESDIASLEAGFFRTQAYRLGLGYNSILEQLGLTESQLATAHIPMMLRRGIELLRDLRDALHRYIVSLRFKSERFLSGGAQNKIDYLLAHIQFGDFDVQREAVTRLAQHLRAEAMPLSLEPLKDILMLKNNSLRRHIIQAFCEAEDLPKAVRMAAETAYERTVESFIDDRRFYDAVEEVALLLSLPKGMEFSLERLWYQGITEQQQIIILRTLRDLETEAALDILLSRYGNGIHYPAVARAFVDDCIAIAGVKPDRTGHIQQIFERMAENSDPFIKTEGIRGLVHLPEVPLSILKQRLRSEGDEMVLAEVYAALSESPLSREVLREFVSSANDAITMASEPLKIGAACFLATKGSTEKQMRAASEILLEAATHVDTILFKPFYQRIGKILAEQILDIRYLKDHLSSILNVEALLRRGDEFCLYILTALAKGRDRDGARLLIELSDLGPVARTRAIVELLFTHYDDPETLRGALSLVFRLYRGGRYDFSLFDGYATNTATLKKFLVLRQDRETLLQLEAFLQDPKITPQGKSFGKVLASLLH